MSQNLPRGKTNKNILLFSLVYGKLLHNEGVYCITACYILYEKKLSHLKVKFI